MKKAKYISLNPIVICFFLLVVSHSEALVPELRITEEGSEASLPLSAVSVNVTVRGHLAKTEFNLTYRNQLDRDVSAEFLFPLPSSATLTDIGLYFDENLRHAVAVEKEKGRIAFDETVHRKIDPALAEWINGNTFRLDVYPVPANNTKTVYVAYEQDLQRTKNNLNYSLDLHYRKTLEKFNLIIDSDETFLLQPTALQLQGELGKWRFNTENYYLDASISLKATQRKDVVALAEPSEEAGKYYISLPIKKYIRKNKLRPSSSVIVFWDVSGSSSSTNVERLYSFLKEFVLSQQQDVSLTLIPFHLDFENHYNIESVQTTLGLLKLKGKLKSLIPVGGTDLVKLFREMPEILGRFPGDSRVLLVTDGQDSMHSVSEVLATVRKVENSIGSVLVVSGSQFKDSNVLTGIAANTAGWCVSLEDDTDISELVSISNRTSTSFSLDTKPSEFYDAVLREIAGDDLILASKAYNAAGISTVSIRYSSAYATHIKHIPFQFRILENAKGIVRSSWARTKLQELLEEGAKDSEILSHGLKYQLMTPQTSLIVLDSWQQYEDFGIDMPPDVKKQYEEDKKEIARLEAQTPPPPVVTEKPSPPVCTHATASQLYGQVTDDKGWPLPGAVVTAKSDTESYFTHTNNCGEFYFDGLPPEKYSVSVELEGFTEVRQEDISVASSDKIRVNYSVQPALAEEFTVVGESPAVSTTATGSYYDFDSYNAFLTDLKNSSVLPIPTRELLDSTLAEMASIKNLQERERFYAKAREIFKRSPQFFLRSHEIFSADDSTFSSRIMMDITEFNFFSTGVYRMLARNVFKDGKDDLAMQFLQKAIMMASYEPQTWRDLALLYAKTGELERAREYYKEALKEKNIDRYPQMLPVLEQEQSRLVQATSALDLEMQPDTDLKIVLNWNSDYTDVDLHVKEPSGQEVFYSNTESPSGGKLYGDVTSGYGPEVYEIKNAPKGVYEIYLEYYSDDASALSMSNLASITVYLRNPNGEIIRNDYTVNLISEKDRIFVASAKF
jgi:tetratricopeptide (TPR) repeat protein